MSYTDEMAQMLGMEETARCVRVSMPLCEKTVQCEISEDYTLPDYQPEIRRVLALTQTVLPPAVYVGGGKAEFNGTVDYRLLYVSGDGSLCTAPLSAEYGFEAPFEMGGKEFDLNGGVCSFVSVENDTLNTRVTGPRKLSLRHRLRGRVRSYGQMVSAERFSREASPESIRRLTAEIGRMEPVSAMSELLPFQDECVLPSEDSRVISAESCVFISSAKAREGGLLVSGEVLLNMLVESGGSVSVLRRKLPFEGEIEEDGFREGAAACADGCVSDLKVQVEEGKLICEGEMLLTGRSMSELPFLYTEDLYSTDAETECEYTEYEIPQCLKCENRNFSQSERIPLEEARLPEGGQILDAWGEAKWETCDTTEDRYVWTGQCRYSILCQKEGEYSVSDLTLPLRYETERTGGEAMSYDGRAKVISCRTRVEDGMLCLDAELALCADYVGYEKVRCVSGVHFGEACQARENCMTVYYPTAGDTPWSVAKKYQIPEESLKGDLGSYFWF